MTNARTGIVEKDYCKHDVIIKFTNPGDKVVYEEVTLVWTSASVESQNVLSWLVTAERVTSILSKNHQVLTMQEKYGEHSDFIFWISLARM